jgi:rubrerythrin
MIAQRTKVVITSDEATVQAAVKLLTQRGPVMLYHWECEVCGMVHSGSMPTKCDSCGKEGSLVQRSDVRTEICSRW